MPGDVCVAHRGTWRPVNERDPDDESSRARIITRSVVRSLNAKVEPAGCTVHRIVPIDGTSLVLCACGRAGSTRKTGSATTTEPNQLGVLVIDARDGRISNTVRFPGALRDEAVVWMSVQSDAAAEGHDDAEGDHQGGKDAGRSVRVACVTSSGSLWRFRVHAGLGDAADYTGHGDDEILAVHSDALLQALVSEDSPMEDLVLAMDAVEVGSASASANGTTSDLMESDPTKGAADSLPRFVSENGYRGARPGYTYWGGDDGIGPHHDDGNRDDRTASEDAQESHESHAAGYYRNDVMRALLAARRQRDRRRPPADGKQTDRRNKKKLLRCFLHLPRSSKFVACSHEPQDGMLTVGDLELSPADAGEPSVSNLDCVMGHLSGVLVVAASPNVKYLASGSYDETIRIVDTATWTCIRILKGHGGGIKCLAFSEDGTQLISAASDNTTRVWSTATWMCMRQLHGRHEDATWPVSQALTTIPTTPTTPTTPMTPSSSPSSTPASSPPTSAKLLVSGSNGLFGGSTLKLFDVTSGNCLATFAQLRYDHKGSCSAVCFSQSPTQQLAIVTAATDASLAGWTCDLSHQPASNKPRLAKGFFT